MGRFTLALFAAFMSAMMICPQAQGARGNERVGIIGGYASSAYAQAMGARRGNVRVGIIGGYTSSSAYAKDLRTTTTSHYHIGFSAQFPIDLGFMIQPGLLYTTKGTAATYYGTMDTQASYHGTVDTQASYIEIPVQLQWGPDIEAFRPYAFIEPFVGYGLKAVTHMRGGIRDVQADSFRNGFLSRWEYGFGLGLGVDVWKLQVSAKYYWNFGSLYTENADIGQTIINAFKDGRNFNGISCSLAFFF